ncbi:YceD family protein [Micromonospora sp. WMMD736]|uniref:YceD family protein n=1 Tax=Micromonospora sp. WMMD736 TaxID=3404112 RepID=UPI003B9234E2
MAHQVNAAARREPRSPLVINIARLGRRPGSMMTMHQSVPSPTRIGLDLIAIAPGAELDLDLRLQSVSEGVLVTGSVSAPTAGECARCLTPVTDAVTIELTELFAYPASATDETADADEVSRVVNDTIDLEQPIVDAVGLALPFAPLCRPDCSGLCPDCGVALATAEPGHHHDKIDPRWAKLSSMFDEDA